MDISTIAFGRRPACLLLMALLSLQLTAGLAAYSGGDVAVYWGRNKDEGTLRETCDTGSYTTVIISFLVAFGHGQYKLDLSGHDIGGVGDDINYCKSKGIMVLLSIGGPGGEYSLPSSQAASDLSEYLWNAFIHGSGAGMDRPFGAAAVDGIDFFIDQGATERYDELARNLYAYNKYYKGGGLTLTATPRCAYPDQRLTAALATGLFNRIHVRLFGDDRQCVSSPWESWLSWEKWAAAYPNSRVFVGVVAAPEAAPAGYMSQRSLSVAVLRFAEKVPNYGGIMVWDRYYDKKDHYISST